MMHVKVLAFGISRDILGDFNNQIELQEQATVSDFKDALLAKFPDFCKLTSLRVALNGEYANDADIITSRDEIVLIPPVSGG